MCNKKKCIYIYTFKKNEFIPGGAPAPAPSPPLPPTLPGIRDPGGLPPPRPPAGGLGGRQPLKIAYSGGDLGGRRPPPGNNCKLKVLTDCQQVKRFYKGHAIDCQSRQGGTSSGKGRQVGANSRRRQHTSDRKPSSRFKVYS